MRIRQVRDVCVLLGEPEFAEVEVDGGYAVHHHFVSQLHALGVASRARRETQHVAVIVFGLHNFEVGVAFALLHYLLECEENNAQPVGFCLVVGEKLVVHVYDVFQLLQLAIALGQIQIFGLQLEHAIYQVGTGGDCG